MQIRLKDILGRKPCYTERQIRYISKGREFITPTEIAALDIPADDRLWVLTELMTYPQASVYARRVASSVLHLWDAPDVVRQWLETGDPELRESAWTAARAAAAEEAAADALVAKEAAWAASGASCASAGAARVSAKWAAAAWGVAVWGRTAAARAAARAAEAEALNKYIRWAAEELERCN